jgi:chitosanase
VHFLDWDAANSQSVAKNGSGVKHLLRGSGETRSAYARWDKAWRWIAMSALAMSVATIACAPEGATPKVPGGQATSSPPADPTSPEPDAPKEAEEGVPSAEQRTRMDRIINNFEHGTIELGYGSAEVLDDGRGITFGRAGFTTQSGDGLEVVEGYSRERPENRLARYLPRLRELATAKSGSIEGLDGFLEAVREASDDPVFQRAQDELQERLYYLPSRRTCDKLGLRTALARLAVYDSLLMHGGGKDPDGLPAMLDRTRMEAGGTPATGVDEQKWLSAFLRVRRDVITHAHNRETRKAWAHSVGRLDVIQALIDQGNWELHGPIVLRGEYAATIP